LRAQSTGQAFWVLGKISKGRKESIQAYAEAAQRNYSLGLIGLGHKEPSIVGELLLYLAAIKNEEAYGWIELAECAFNNPENPVIKYLTGDADPTTVLEEQISSEDLVLEMLREKLRIGSNQDALNALTSLQLNTLKEKMDALRRNRFPDFPPLEVYTMVGRPMNALQRNRFPDVPVKVYRMVGKLPKASQLVAYFYLHAGEKGILSAYHKLAGMLDQYSPTRINFSTGSVETRHIFSLEDFNLFKRRLYEVMSREGDPWRAYELAELKRDPGLCKKVGDFKSYLELSFSYGIRSLYEDALRSK